MHGARHALHSHWWLPLFAYRARPRGLGHLQERVSKLCWLQCTANNRKVRGSAPRGTKFSKSTIQQLCLPHTHTSIGQLFSVHCPNIHCLIAHLSIVPLSIVPRSDCPIVPSSNVTLSTCPLFTCLQRPLSNVPLSHCPLVPLSQFPKIPLCTVPLACSPISMFPVSRCQLPQSDCPSPHGLCISLSRCPLPNCPSVPMFIVPSSAAPPSHGLIVRLSIVLTITEKTRRYAQQLEATKALKNKTTASILGLGAVNAQTALLVLNSFRSRSLAYQTHDHRDWG